MENIKTRLLTACLTLGLCSNQVYAIDTREPQPSVWNRLKEAGSTMGAWVYTHPHITVLVAAIPLAIIQAEMVYQNNIEQLEEQLFRRGINNTPEARRALRAFLSSSYYTADVLHWFTLYGMYKAIRD